jgi:hypothetical protein
MKILKKISKYILKMQTMITNVRRSSPLKMFAMLSGALVALAAAPSATASVIWLDNGHSYELILSGPISWTAAESASQAAGGHLVSVNSAAENAFLVAKILPTMSCAGTSPCTQGAGNNFIWHGLQTSTTWSSGELVTYTNWSPGEPNGDGPTAHFWDRGNTSWQWNDLGDAAHSRILGYVLEKSAVSSVPEPSSVALLLLGLAGIGYRRKTHAR